MNGKRLAVLLVAGLSSLAQTARADQCPPGTEQSEWHVFGPAAVVLAITLAVTVLLARRASSKRSYGWLLVGVPLFGLLACLALIMVGGFTAPCVGEIDTHPFVSPEVKHLPQRGASRLMRKDLVAADGSRQFFTWYDAKLRIDCRLETHWDDAERCYPQTPFTHGVAMPLCADARCSKTMLVELCEGAAQEFIKLAQEDKTTGKPEMGTVQIGAAIDASRVYNPRSDCMAQQRGLNCTIHPVRKTIPLGELATRRDAPMGDGGRLPTEVPNKLVDGTRLKREGGAVWVDTKLDVECDFGFARDGEIRCLPYHPGFGMSLVYLDALCSVAALTYCDTRREPYKIEEYTFGKSDSQRTGLQREGFAQVGKKVTPPPTVYTSVGGRCQEQPARACPIFRLVKRFEPEDFVGATIVADAPPSR